MLLTIYTILFIVVIFKREQDSIVHQLYEDFENMKADQKKLAVAIKDEYKPPSATCLFKDNNYWLYHRDTIDDSEEEKTNPGEKLWLVMRLM